MHAAALQIVLLEVHTEPPPPAQVRKEAGSLDEQARALTVLFKVRPAYVACCCLVAAALPLHPQPKRQFVPSALCNNSVCCACFWCCVQAGGEAVDSSGRESLLSAFGPQEVMQLLIAASDLDLQLPLLPQLAVLLQVGGKGGGGCVARHAVCGRWCCARSSPVESITQRRRL